MCEIKISKLKLSHGGHAYLVMKDHYPQLQMVFLNISIFISVRAIAAQNGGENKEKLFFLSKISNGKSYG